MAVAQGRWPGYLLQLPCRVSSFPQMPPWLGRIPSPRKDETRGGGQTQTMCILSPCQVQSGWTDRVLDQAWRAWGPHRGASGYPGGSWGQFSFPTDYN